MPTRQVFFILFLASFIFLFTPVPESPDLIVSEWKSSWDFRYGISDSAFKKPRPLDRGVFIGSVEAADNQDSMNRCTEQIAHYLERVHSPMIHEAWTFAKAARRNDLDCYLLPAISGVESSFGKSSRPGSYNPFGWNNGKYGFKDWRDAIDVVADSLGTKYAKRWAATTPEQIGRYYAADPNWPRKVRSFMGKIAAQPI